MFEINFLVLYEIVNSGASAYMLFYRKIAVSEGLKNWWEGEEKPEIPKYLLSIIQEEKEQEKIKKEVSIN